MTQESILDLVERMETAMKWIPRLMLSACGVICLGCLAYQNYFYPHLTNDQLLVEMWEFYALALALGMFSCGWYWGDLFDIGIVPPDTPFRLDVCKHHAMLSAYAGRKYFLAINSAIEHYEDGEPDTPDNQRLVQRYFRDWRDHAEQAIELYEDT